MKSKRVKLILMFGLVFGLSFLGFYGCGSDNGTETGQVTIGLTDGAGDFASYNVGVASIKLTTEDGAEVEVLPEDVMVDFAQYEDETELVVTTDVPVGVYTSVVVTLDYTAVDVTVDNGNGEIVGVDVLVDPFGEPMTQVSVNVTDMVAVEVTQGRHVYVSVDYDLALSHGSFEFDSEQGTVVVVTPYVSVNVDYATFKPLRVRGTLADVDTENDEFTVNVKPFFITFNPAYSHFGKMVVASQDTTVYRINGEAYVGHEGLEALAASGEGIPVVARGEIAFEPFRLVADTVYAGTSLPGTDSDFVRGIVTSVGENTARISGMVYDHANIAYYFDSSVDVTFSDATSVMNIADGTGNLDNLFIGQYILVSGEITDTGIDASQGTVWLYQLNVQ